MKRKLTYFMLMVFLPAIMFAQLKSLQPGGLLLQKDQTCSISKESVTPQQNEFQGQNSLNKLSATNNFYVNSRIVGSKNYRSHVTSSPATSTVIKADIIPANELFEGTTDDKGYWWAISSNHNFIFKIDPANGEILQQVSAPAGGNSLYGIAYCPVDKLIYLICQNVVNGNLFSMTTAGDAPVFVRTYAGIQPWGLACTDDGTLYSFDNLGGLPLIKFYPSVAGKSAVGASINVGGFLANNYIELECDHTTNNVYLLSQNGLNATHAELRLVNLTLGNSTLVYDFNVVGGIQALAFNCGVSAVPQYNGKFDFTSPRGGEKWAPGSVHIITWKKINGYVLGSFFLDYSTDGGDTWTVINRAPFIGASQYPWKVPDEINSNNCLLRISNYNSRKVIDVSSTFSIVPVSSSSVVRNYPNPFNPSTKITFNLEKNALTSLKVFNTIGQQVAELVNQTLEAGDHEYEFNASNLPSGVYYYNLKVENNSIINKMLLLK